MRKRRRNEGLARSIALAAHGATGQKDKAGRPYKTHLFSVAADLVKQKASSPVIQAGWLHDVFEDTDLMPVDLYGCGIKQEVIDLILTLTRGDETYREYILRLASASKQVQQIKIADLTDHLTNGVVIPDSLKQRYYDALAILSGGGGRPVNVG